MNLPNHIIHTLQITGWFAFILANVIYDNRHYRNINHSIELIIRIGVGILYAGLAFGVRSADEWALHVILFMWTSFYLFFELLLNVSMGLHPLYLGSTATIDKFIRKYLGGQQGYLMLKIFTVVLLIYSTIQIYKA